MKTTAPVRSSMAIESILNPFDEDSDMNMRDQRSRSHKSTLTDEDPVFSAQTSKESTPASSIDGMSSASPPQICFAKWYAVPVPVPNAYRRPYSKEQIMWIWFFTTDKVLARKEMTDDVVTSEVVDAFNAEWPWDQRNLGGLQCRLYRLHNGFAEYGLPPRRQQKAAGPRGKVNPLVYGMWAVTGYRFKWMDPYAGSEFLEGKSISHRHWSQV